MRWAWVLALGACSFRAGGASDAPSAPGGDAVRASDAAVGGDAHDAAVAPLDATPPAFAMSGMQWVIPCKTNLNNATPPGCSCNRTSASYTNAVTLTGSASDTWLVTVRIAGAMEPFAFEGGAPDGSGWYVGGDTSNTPTQNSYRIDVSAPMQHYYINNGVESTNWSLAFDYTASFPVEGDATVTFTADPGDTAQWQGVDESGTPIALPGVTAPGPTATLYPQWAYVIVQSASPM